METLGTISWTDAKCATGDARLLHLFFSEAENEIAEAKVICQTCPLQLPCLEQACLGRPVVRQRQGHRPQARTGAPPKGRGASAGRRGRVTHCAGVGAHRVDTPAPRLTRSPARTPAGPRAGLSSFAG